jgi:two-component sensor histidine kinase
MTVQNAELLHSQEALQALVQTALPGTAALRVRDIVEEVQSRVQRIQEVRKDLMQREDMDEAETQEEWEQVLQDETEIDTDPLPEAALEDIEVEAGHLLALDWMIER